VPVAVERSRSGNGAHAWLFFESAIAVATARTVGSFLITETMSRRHEMRMVSYDRLFPSQDTMPRGGFGNLIALPLQLEARQQGNTVFLDEALDPVPDQWAYLNAVVRMTRRRVEELAADATARGLIVGVRDAGLEDEDLTPWARRPPRGHAKLHIEGPLPAGESSCGRRLHQSLVEADKRTMARAFTTHKGDGQLERVCRPHAVFVGQSFREGAHFFGTVGFRPTNGGVDSAAAWPSRAHRSSADRHGPGGQTRCVLRQACPTRPPSAELL
jgi:hypothetical protein